MFNIKKIIRESGMTANQIAKKAGIQHTIIYKLVNGDIKDIYLSTAIKIADVLEISLDEFREGEEK